MGINDPNMHWPFSAQFWWKFVIQCTPKYITGLECIYTLKLPDRQVLSIAIMANTWFQVHWFMYLFSDSIESAQTN